MNRVIFQEFSGNLQTMDSTPGKVIDYGAFFQKRRLAAQYDVPLRNAEFMQRSYVDKKKLLWAVKSAHSVGVKSLQRLQ